MDCLVTKLKASVNNDELLRLGILTVSFENVSDLELVVSAENDRVVSLETSEGLSIVSGANTMFPHVTGTGKLYIHDKYNIVQPGMNTLSKYKWEDLKACSKVLRFIFRNNNISGFETLSQLTVFTSLAILNISNTTDICINGDIKDICGLPIMRFNIRNTNVIGNAAELGLLPLSTIEGIVNTNINGSIEDMIAVRRGCRGETTGSITWNYPYTQSGNITFQGEKIPASLEGSSVILSWTATTITFGSITINNDSIINQSQLEVLRANGYQH